MFNKTVYADIFSSNNIPFTLESFRASSVGFNVYYANQQYTLISETPKITIFDLLTQIGGSLGMFISLSIFTLFELCELVVLISFELVRNKLFKNKLSMFRKMN